jgi:tetratricopeptide (TPR) repeat protein
LAGFGVQLKTGNFRGADLQERQSGLSFRAVWLHSAYTASSDGVFGVDANRLRSPVLVGYYQRYLNHQDSSIFLGQVSERYACATLERLVTMSDCVTRRAAVLALSCTGDYASNAVLGRALVDRDRGVRSIAANGIRELWCRVGNRQQRQSLQYVVRLNDSKRYEEAINLATQLIHESPWIAEAWCQRGMAHFHRGQYESAIRDCHQALEINPYHFTAAAGMGQCYLLQDNPVAALEAFRRALRLNPGMEEVRAQVVRLQRSLKED